MVFYYRSNKNVEQKRGLRVIKIAICDDEENICTRIEEFILDYGIINKVELDIQIFYTGEALLRLIQNGVQFDLVFLDIEMQPMNGIEVGKTIREKIRNEIIKIVYISAIESYAMELFEVRPLHFLIKPISKKKVIWTVTKAMELLEKDETVFEFSCNKTTVRVPIKNIMYFTSEARKVKIIMENEDKEFYGKLSDVEKQLNHNFVRIHKSYFINSKYVSEYTYENIHLCNGDMLNIARKYRNEVRKILMKRE